MISSPLKISLGAVAATLIVSAVGYAASNRVSVTEQGSKRCIAANGVPDHATGQFPNRNNPHRISAQNVSACLPANPRKGGTARRVGTIGIAKNGVIIRPGTADYYDASSPRGHSRDRSSGWNLDGMGASDTLGLDRQNAHVGPNGEYHYHGMPPALTAAATGEGTLMGWAADGFEIHYIGSKARSSYMLLPGTRDSAPGGAHDGTYVEDWQYVKGAGNLDRCNGAMVNGKYVYFATDTYPFFPRCLYGTEITQLGPEGGQGGQRPRGQGRPPRPPRG